MAKLDSRRSKLETKDPSQALGGLSQAIQKDGWTEGWKVGHMEICPYVLQDIAPWGPLPFSQPTITANHTKQGKGIAGHMLSLLLFALFAYIGTRLFFHLVFLPSYCSGLG